ncbi:hypothetical protein ACJJTC_019458 [Scirpophaga incertulas]
MSESSKSKSSNLNPPPTLQCKDLHEYLKSRSPQFLETLYNYPTICLAVYRELPELARHFVIRLLFVEQPVPQAVVTSWVSQTFAKEQSKACEALSELSVWQEAPIPGGMPGWMLAQSFKKNLKVALLGGGRPWSLSSALEPDGRARDAAFLDAYARERWECVLHYMVGSSRNDGISADAVRVLLHAGLMARDTEDGSAVITRAGFQFLLLSTAKQVGCSCSITCTRRRSAASARPSVLAFLYQLSFSTLGKDYSTEGMSNNMLVFLQHLREFGLVYQRKRKAGRFLPDEAGAQHSVRARHGARAAAPAALAPSTGTAAADPPRGYIVVETNYRVYAYTQSALQVALLGLFTELVYRYRWWTGAALAPSTAAADPPRGYIVVETNYRVYAYTQSALQVALLGLFTELVYRYRWWTGAALAPGTAAADPPRGYIVVETNYRVYAYTQSALQVALLGLFTELVYRYRWWTGAALAPSTAAADPPRGYIVVETNYRVYAYTQSALQVALLGLFTELVYRYRWWTGAALAPSTAAADPPRGYIVVETNYRVYAYTQSALQVALLGLFTELVYRYRWWTVRAAGGAAGAVHRAGVQVPLVDRCRPGAQHRGRGPAARLHRGGDQLPRVRVHAVRAAGGAAGAVHRAGVQVPLVDRCRPGAQHRGRGPPRGYIVVETNYRVYAYTQSALQVALLGLFTELVYRYRWWTGAALAPSTAAADPPRGYIVVETNYRVYAYTQSALQVALLGLFTELVYRFPDLVVGVLTRESVRQALRGGITAQQIVHYLEQHAHPQMLNSESGGIRSASPLPPTVVDQVRLWEGERNRFTYSEGVVYNQFLSQADFVAVREFARSAGVLTWHSERTRTALVTRAGHDARAHVTRAPATTRAPLLGAPLQGRAAPLARSRHTRAGHDPGAASGSATPRPSRASSALTSHARRPRPRAPLLEAPLQGRAAPLARSRHTRAGHDPGAASGSATPRPSRASSRSRHTRAGHDPGAASGSATPRPSRASSALTSHARRPRPGRRFWERHSKAEPRL